MLIMDTLTKFNKSIMECLYKFLSPNVNEYGFTIVDLRIVGHKDEPWVPASTIAQVFYILDLKDDKKHIIVPGKQ
jgi:hypothetical protein